jgi:hypothetical protein
MSKCYTPFNYKHFIIFTKIKKIYIFVVLQLYKVLYFSKLEPPFEWVGMGSHTCPPCIQQSSDWQQHVYFRVNKYTHRHSERDERVDVQVHVIFKIPLFKILLSLIFKSYKTLKTENNLNFYQTWHFLFFKTGIVGRGWDDLMGWHGMA